MNKLLKKVLVTATLFATCNAHAALVMNGTRFVFNEGAKTVDVRVENQSERTYGGQVWIENISSEDEQIYLAASPSFFKLNTDESQLVRIMKVNDLPADEESLFWLNVQEIPPKGEDGQATLSLAMRSKLKVIYRPAALAAERRGAETQIKLVQKGNGLYLHNPTPYYFAINKVKRGGEVVQVNDLANLGVFAPGASVYVGEYQKQGDWSVNAVDDYGAFVDYQLKP